MPKKHIGKHTSAKRGPDFAKQVANDSAIKVQRSYQPNGLLKYQRTDKSRFWYATVVVTNPNAGEEALLNSAMRDAGLRREELQSAQLLFCPKTDGKIEKFQVMASFKNVAPEALIEQRSAQPED